MPSKVELYEQATQLDIEGRSDMTKAELEAAIAAAEDTATGTAETGDFLCPHCNKLADHIHARGV